MSRRARLWLVRILGAVAAPFYVAMVGADFYGLWQRGPLSMRAVMGACGIALLWWGWRYMWPEIVEDWRGLRG